MVEITDHENCTVVNIAPTGDIVLVVGPEERQLRVQTLILEGASKAFAALLSPNRKDGRHVTDADGILRLRLPEDDAMWMKCICEIIHHRPGSLAESLSVSDILGIAHMVDKYDFIAAMALTSGMLLLSGNRKADELMVLMVAAFLFQNASAFKMITKSLILNHGDSYLAISNKDVEAAIGSSIICK